MQARIICILYDVKGFVFCCCCQETMAKGYENFKFQQPYQQAMYYCRLILEEQTWPWDEELAALSNLEASDLENFLPHMLAKTFIECYFAGLSILGLNVFVLSH
jgi:secreted Zn-dependent insulinase-like peptidase